MNFVGSDEIYAANKLSENPEESGMQVVDTVRVVKLDDDIKEEITFLKIDCEGMDKETLRGASGLVKKYHPRIHLDSYHKIEDLIEVPKLIKEIDPSYTLYFRITEPYGLTGSFHYFPVIAYFAV
jgi:hypothetical protein